MSNWTPQQEAVIAFARDERESLIVQAAAGSGKTTTLVEAANQTPGEVAALAFNKRIADTLSSRMPEVTCRTMNSFGHRAWGKQVGRRLKLEPSKMFTISNADNFKQWEFKIRVAARQLADMAKQVGLVPDGAMGTTYPLVPDEQEAWLDLIDLYDIDCNGLGEDSVIELARLFLLASIQQAWAGLIDFNDQIYMTAIYRAPLDRFDCVFVDEAQDISAIQRALITRMSKGRIIAVGDRHQAIYGWRGASHTSMDDFREAFNAEELPLSVSFRCPKSVVAEARKIYTHIDPWEGSPEGTVDGIEKWSFDKLERGAVFVCRNNAPIVSLAFRMLRSNVGCNVLGRDIGTGMISTLKKLGAPDQIKRAGDMIGLLEAEMNSKVEAAVARNRANRVEYINDKYQSIMAVVESCQTTQQAIDNINTMFEDKHGAFTLSTIHKFKGSEAKRIYFLDKHLLPSKYAKSEESKIQEANLEYVAITRAMSHLTYINSDDREK